MLGSAILPTESRCNCRRNARARAEPARYGGHDNSGGGGGFLTCRSPQTRLKQGRLDKPARYDAPHLITKPFIMLQFSANVYE